MKQTLFCRRTYIATLAILSLVGIGLYNNFDVSWAIASIAVGLAGSNAAESAMKALSERPKE